MHICIACYPDFNWSVHGPTFDSQVFAITWPPAKSTHLVFCDDRMYFVVRSFLQDLKIIANDLSIWIKLNFILCLAGDFLQLSRLARNDHSFIHSDFTNLRLHFIDQCAFLNPHGYLPPSLDHLHEILFQISVTDKRHVEWCDSRFLILII